MKILIADDHRLIRDGLRIPLSRLDDDVEIFEAESLGQAMNIADGCADIDLVMLDLGMPGMNRFAGIDAMRRKLPETPVVILSGSIEPQDILTSLAKGAAGYIPKTLGARAMIGALQTVLAGERYLPSIVLEGQDGTEILSGGVAGDGPLASLSPRERDVLDHLVLGEPNKQIARELGIGEPTVKLHLVSIYRKIGVSNRTQAVRSALDAGWAA